MAASFALTILATLGADRVIGLAFRETAAGTGAIPSGGLVMPPHSRVRYETAEFVSTASVNALGFRGPDMPVAKSPDTYRIVAIGDSYTYGWGVNDDETWPLLLERGLRQSGYNVEVANLGQAGHMPSHYADVAERAIPVLRPDLVLVVVTMGEDVAQAAYTDVMGKIWALHMYVDRASQQQRDPSRARALLVRAYPNLLRVVRRAREHQIRETWKQMAGLFLSSMTGDQLRRFERLDPDMRRYFGNGDINASLYIIALTAPEYLLRYLDVESAETQTRIAELAASLRRIRDVAKPYGARVLVVSAPYGPYVSPKTLAGFRRVGFRVDERMLTTDGPDRTIALAAGQARTRHVSVTETFREAPNVDALYYPLDGHMTPAGAAYFARSLEPFVAEYVRRPEATAAVAGGIAE